MKVDLIHKTFETTAFGNLEPGDCFICVKDPETICMKLHDSYSAVVLCDGTALHVLNTHQVVPVVQMETIKFRIMDDEEILGIPEVKPIW